LNYVISSFFFGCATLQNRKVLFFFFSGCATLQNGKVHFAWGEKVLDYIFKKSAPSKLINKKIMIKD